MEIREEYGDWTPPATFRQSVERLLKYVPQQYLLGIDAIWLTDSRTLNRARRRQRTRVRGRRVRLSESSGLYHAAWKGQPAWIELFADRMVEGHFGLQSRMRMARDLAVGETLFHEIGHHIHKTKYPQHEEPEEVADRWKGKLLGRFLRRRYWYLVPPVFILRPLWNLIERRWGPF